MTQTIVEKIIARAAGVERVSPGEYVVLKHFVGPIGYSFTGFNFAAIVQNQLKRLGLDSIANPEKCILNGDHNTPHQSEEDVILFREVREKANQLGIEKIYEHQGIGHVVNVEKGDILPGAAFVHMDPQSTNAGGIGAYYTNGGRLGGNWIEAFAFGELTICVPGTLRIEINGQLPSGVTGRDVWFKVLNDLGPAGAHAMFLEFCGSTIEDMNIEDRMVLCGSAGFCGADGAIIQSDARTREWFKVNFGRDVETLLADPGATYADTHRYQAEEFVPMVTVPPEIFTSKPASELRDIKLDQCMMGTCAGGSLSDLRIAAHILNGKSIHPDVRFIVSPVTQRVYTEAAKEGLIGTLSDAGVTVMSSTCDVCVGVAATLAAGEVCLSQQTLNAPGRSGSDKAEIYLAGAATIATSALTGFITAPEAAPVAEA